jgi:NADH-quinone oxidoreductase subunit H
MNLLPSLPTIVALVKIGLLIGGLMTAAAYLVLVERWMAAWVQDRKGPNRVGIPLTKVRMFGLGQPLADGLKIILKEDFTPRHVDRVLYTAAPLVILAASLAIFAAIPFGSSLPPIPALGLTGEEPLLVAPGLDVGVLWVFALSSIAVYGVLLGGWASNNKYGFLGGLRSSAQLVAYEIPLGLGLLGVVLAAGSLKLDTIMNAQASTGVWYAFAQPLGFIVFLVAAFAEAARLPFDLPEAEQELVGGYHTEYSGIKLLLFLVAEFLHMVTAAFLIVIMFLGGWHLWGVTGSGPVETWTVALIRFAVLSAKILGVILFFMLVRWSWPRFRFDQLEGDAAAGHPEPGHRGGRGGVPAAARGRARRGGCEGGGDRHSVGGVLRRLDRRRPAHALGHRQHAGPHPRPDGHRTRTRRGLT